MVDLHCGEDCEVEADLLAELEALESGFGYA